MLHKRDREGSRAPAVAKECARKRQGGGKAEGRTTERARERREAMARGRQDAGSGGARASEREEAKSSRKRLYFVNLVKRLGSNPTSKDGCGSADTKLQSKVCSLTVIIMHS